MPPHWLQPVVTLCLLDISRGLQYLHSCGIVSAPACACACARHVAPHCTGSAHPAAPLPPLSQVHGDLKPENVLLKAARSDRRGYVCKLGDFGLSRLLGDEQTHVDTGACRQHAPACSMYRGPACAAA